MTGHQKLIEKKVTRNPGIERSELAQGDWRLASVTSVQEVLPEFSSFVVTLGIVSPHLSVGLTAVGMCCAVVQKLGSRAAAVVADERTCVLQAYGALLGSAFGLMKLKKCPSGRVDMCI